MRFDQIEPKVNEELFRVVVETPKGSHHKFAFEPELKAFVLRKSLPEGMVFPFDFGFVPKTRGDDGDPFDVLILSDAPLFAGCVVPCRIIGVIEAEQTEKKIRERNDRFVAVADASLEWGDIKDAKDLPPHVIEQTEQFFVSYNKIGGKRFQVLSVLGAKAAAKRLKKAFKKSR
jgi:inorganic pyrophosphatase